MAWIIDILVSSSLEYLNSALFANILLQYSEPEPASHFGTTEKSQGSGFNKKPP